jgi:hypothetical protein
MHPVELRILNAYRDGDMKAHRRTAKNCALIECCQVVAEKAGIRISPEAKAASSLRDGGGARGQLPAFTATDEAGRVEGFTAGSYARKGAKGQDAVARPVAQGVSQPAAPAPRPAAAAQPARPTEAPRPPEPPQGPSPAPARTGALRFSSLSGFRRR